jgi:signal transduction histidine kinase
LNAIGTFSSSVLHDLKNPVDGMRLIIEELKNETAANDEKRAYIEALHTGVLKLKRDLVKSFELNKNTRHPEEKIDLNRIVREVVEDFKNLPYPGIKVHLEKGRNTIEGIADEIKHALGNLIENAFESSDYTHEIEISTYRNNRHTFIDIRDYGKGIPIERLRDLSRMFSSTRGEGRGLGLSITKNIIERHGGYIDFKSIENKGTLFSIAFPIRERRKVI